MLEAIVIALLLVIMFMLMATAVAAGVWWARSRQASKPGVGLKRIRLSDGQWAMVRSHLTQTMWNALLAARPPNVQQNESGRIVDVAGADVTDLVGDVVMRALILSGVVEWSYGEVDEDVLAEAVPQDDQQVLSQHFESVLMSSPKLTEIQDEIDRSNQTG